MSAAIIVMVIVLVVAIAGIVFLFMLRLRPNHPHEATRAAGPPIYTQQPSSTDYYRPSQPGEEAPPPKSMKAPVSRPSSDLRDTPLPRCPGCDTAIAYEQERCPKCGLVLRPL